MVPLFCPLRSRPERFSSRRFTPFRRGLPLQCGSFHDTHSTARCSFFHGRGGVGGDVSTQSRHCRRLPLPVDTSRASLPHSVTFRRLSAFSPLPERTRVYGRSVSPVFPRAPSPAEHPASTHRQQQGTGRNASHYRHIFVHSYPNERPAWAQSSFTRRNDADPATRWPPRCTGS